MLELAASVNPSLAALNWGSVADWFAAVGTVGALIFGFLLFANERRQARRAAADAFVIWSVSQSRAADGRPEIDFYFHNAGTAPVFDPALTAKPNRHGYQVFAHLTVDAAPLLPGQHGHARVAFSHLSEGWNAYLSFTDGSGREWHRNMSTSRYTRRPRDHWWDRLWYRIRHRNGPLFAPRVDDDSPPPTITSLTVSNDHTR